MRRIRQYEFGPAENLRYEEGEDPVPGPGQVRVAVAASGVHLVDTAIRAGVPGGPFPLPALPMTPGREVAGTVDAVGEGVPEDGWLGRRVVAHLGQASGGYAELAVAPVTALHTLPDGLTADAAVAMIGTGRTTMGVLETAAIRPDDVVLVAAAAGGIGALAVQAARNAGAAVVGLAGGPAKTALVRELGATAAVDYSADGWPGRVPLTPTVVLDGVGGELGAAAVRLLARGGRHISYGWASRADEATRLPEEELVARGITSVSALGPRMAERPGGLRSLETLALAEVAAGRLRPAVTRFPLADAAGAHRALEGRATTGKVVLVP